MPKAYPSAPNSINQHQTRYLIQDLKAQNPRLYQALTTLKTPPPFLPFSAQISLPGLQIDRKDVLNHSARIRLPIDPYNCWEIKSVIVQDIEISCKTIPTGSNYVADLLISRNNGESFTSIFGSSGDKMTIKKGSNRTVINASSLGTPEWFEGDQFQVDVLQSDGVIADVGVSIRGYSNMMMSNYPGRGSE